MVEPAVEGQLPLRSGRRIGDEQVASAHESHPAAVGRKLRLLLRPALRKSPQRSVLPVVNPVLGGKRMPVNRLDVRGQQQPSFVRAQDVIRKFDPGLGGRSVEQDARRCGTRSIARGRRSSSCSARRRRGCARRSRSSARTSRRAGRSNRRRVAPKRLSYSRCRVQKKRSVNSAWYLHIYYAGSAGDDRSAGFQAQVQTLDLVRQSSYRNKVDAAGGVLAQIIERDAA